MTYLPILRRALLPLLLSSALVACTADGLVPPSNVDSASRVGSIKPHRSAPQRQFSYQGMQDPVVSASNNYANGRRGSGTGEAVTTTDVETGLAPQSSIPSQGVNMDAELGVGPAEEAQSASVVGLAQEEQQNIAEGQTDEPVVRIDRAFCSTGTVVVSASTIRAIRSASRRPG